MFGVRHVDGAERSLLQVRKLRKYERMQLSDRGIGDQAMSALPIGSALAAKQKPSQPRARGFLHIVRHGAGLSTFYIVTYHRLDQDWRATQSDACRRSTGADRSAGTHRGRLPATRGSWSAGRHPAAGIGEHSRSVAERRRDAGTRAGRRLDSRIIGWNSKRTNAPNALVLFSLLLV